MFRNQARVNPKARVKNMDIPLPIVTLTILTIVGVSSYYYWDRIYKPKKAIQDAERRERREARRKERQKEREQNAT